jgi:diguanylate cyclase (GGDEF)-like protein
MSWTAAERQASSMFRTLLRRYGSTPIAVVLTFISILLSVGITTAINIFLYGGPDLTGLVISVLAPLVIAPLLSVKILELVLMLDEAERKLQVLSSTDDLTGAYNRRYFIQFLDHEFKRAQRSGLTFSLAILDMDNFKEINDQWGHLAGDGFLREMTRTFRAHIRQADIFARYGGDEFIILFPQTDQQGVHHWADRLYAECAKKLIHFENVEIQPLFSIGAAAFERKMKHPDDLLKRADIALYQAKRSGGNKFVQYQE